MTRSFGDINFKSIGVYAEPEILEVDLMPRHIFLLLCSDGVTGVLSNKRIADIIYENRDKTAQHIANAIVDESRLKWEEDTFDIDDITVVFSWLDIRRPSLEVVSEPECLSQEAAKSLKWTRHSKKEVDLSPKGNQLSPKNNQLSPKNNQLCPKNNQSCPSPIHSPKSRHLSIQTLETESHGKEIEGFNLAKHLGRDLKAEAKLRCSRLRLKHRSGNGGLSIHLSS